MEEALSKGCIERIKGGESNEVHLLTYADKKYILRKYSNTDDCDWSFYTHNLLKEHGFLPKIIFKKDKNLILEHINGRNCTKNDADDVAYEIGRICGIVNNTGIDEREIKKRSDYEEIFFKYLKNVVKKGVISNKNSISCEEAYKFYRDRIEIITSLDADDVHCDNFMLTGNKIYFVDVDSIKVRIKGRGVTKAFSRWFRKEDQRKKFINGYNTVNSLDFYHGDYRKFCELNFLITSIYYGLESRGKPNEKDMTDLENLIQEFYIQG